jgi:hypothetical protein
VVVVVVVGCWLAAGERGINALCAMHHFLLEYHTQCAYGALRVRMDPTTTSRISLISEYGTTYYCIPLH